jgi:hypothetical protein
MIVVPVAGPAEDKSWPEDVAAAKALFMTEVTRIVEEGRCEMATLESGTLELRFATGEIFYLGEHAITRIA